MHKNLRILALNLLIFMKKTTVNKKSSSNILSKGEVRIISGRFRGKKLPVLNAQGLRPTGDRVKEMVFNWLMFDVADSCCLDGFAGSGSLGFEALSRGAKSVQFLELDKTVANQLKKNLQALKITEEQGKVFNQNSLEYLKLPQTTPHFDLVFLDPPFHFGLSQQAINLLAENNWLKENALIYVETEANIPLTVPQNWQLKKEKTTGQVTARLFQFIH